MTFNSISVIRRESDIGSPKKLRPPISKNKTQKNVIYSFFSIIKKMTLKTQVTDRQERRGSHLPAWQSYQQWRHSVSNSPSDPAVSKSNMINCWPCKYWRFPSLQSCQITFAVSPRPHKINTLMAFFTTSPLKFMSVGSTQAPIQSRSSFTNLWPAKSFKYMVICKILISVMKLFCQQSIIARLYLSSIFSCN